MLTRRGRLVVGIVVVGVVFSLLFGARSLNAVVAPAVVALVAGYVQVRLTPEVIVERLPPEDAHAGETRTVELSFCRPDGEPLSRPFLGDVTELVADGLQPVPDADGGTVTQRADGDAEISFETAVGAEPQQYDVRYERRGRQTLGPATVTATDAFGLFEQQIELRGTESVLAYPRVRRLGSVGRRSLGRLEEYGRSDQRGEFAELREYVPGDPLRDIHWKTTAKRDELVVTDFAAETEAESVTVAVGSNAEGADTMAEATASIVLSLVGDGIPVELLLPRGDLRIGPEYGGQRALLRTLAVVEPGPISEPEADVSIKGRADDARVDVLGTSYSFGALVGDETRARTPSPTGEVEA